MNIFEFPQRSEEWWQLKAGRIGGTRFGQVVSGRKNKLVYELINERLDGQVSDDDYLSEDMQYGIDNEDEALRLYTELTGIKTVKIGAILSAEHDIHIASPDGLSECGKIVQEIKCTQNGATHIQRFFEFDKQYIPQCVNYFAVSPEIEEVHFISYCGYRPEKQIHMKKLLRNEHSSMIDTGLTRIDLIKIEVDRKLEEYRF